VKGTIRIPIVRFQDDTVIKRLIGPGYRDDQSFGMFPPEGRIYFEVDGPSHYRRHGDREDDRLVVEFNRDGAFSYASSYQAGPNAFLPYEDALPARMTLAAAKFTALACLLDLFPVVSGQQFMHYQETTVPMLAPDWLFQGSGRPAPEPPEGQSSQIQAFYKEPSFLDYMRQATFDGRATVKPIEHVPIWNGAIYVYQVTVPIDLIPLAWGLPVNPGTWDLTVKFSPSTISSRWIVHGRDEKQQARGQTFADVIQGYLVQVMGLWPESSGLDGWMKKVSCPIKEILIDQAVIEAYQLLGTRAPWAWLDCDLKAWLDEQGT
jgi:hypothetical protein